MFCDVSAARALPFSREFETVVLRCADEVRGERFGALTDVAVALGGLRLATREAHGRADPRSLQASHVVAPGVMVPRLCWLPRRSQGIPGSWTILGGPCLPS